MNCLYGLSQMTIPLSIMIHRRSISKQHLHSHKNDHSYVLVKQYIEHTRINARNKNNIFLTKDKFYDTKYLNARIITIYHISNQMLYLII